mmetsp:Transcript_37146/g.27455  ORF Transcript_37146/g.27455 Transcript_37146/m.27455 type:complete len:136 (+) Transcript_37146:147-554(+)
MKKFDNKVRMKLDKGYYCLQYFYSNFMLDIDPRGRRDKKKYVMEQAEIKYDRKTDECELPKFRKGKPKKGKEIKTKKKYKAKGKTCGYVTYFEYKKKGKKNEAEFIIWYDDFKGANSLSATFVALMLAVGTELFF